MKRIAIIPLMMFFTACSHHDSLEKVDDTVYTVKSSYVDTTNLIVGAYTKFMNEVDAVTDTVLENKITHFLMPDDVILKNRQKFILWKENSQPNHSAHSILNSYLRKHEPKTKLNTLLLEDKMSIISDFYFDEAKKDYLKNFNQKHPKPFEDEFLTYRENILKIHEYKLALKEANNEWDKNILTTKKEIAMKMLNTLFGNPKIKNINYDVENSRLYLEIYSSSVDFAQKVYIDVNTEEAKQIKKDLHHINPIIYYYFEEDNFKLIGASIDYIDKSYMATLTDVGLIKNRRVIVGNDKLNLKNVTVEYATLLKNAQPPEWVNSLPDNNNEIIGYGTGLTPEEAKEDALKNISLSLYAKVDVEITTQKKSSALGYKKSIQEKSTISSRKQDLSGHKKIKEEKKDGLWWIAMSLPKPTYLVTKTK